jgi:pimeloyl-ACP methyl ester carboxylesterase
MRRVTRLALVAGGAAAVVGAGAFAGRRLQRLPMPVDGIFPNGMAYARLGTGPKTLLFIRSGPGNVLPSRLFMPLMGALWLGPFVESGYTVWVATRKRDMPKGYSVPEMAEDYAGLITDEFGGKVDLVIGEEAYGGMIGFCLAAHHPDRFGHLAVMLSGYRLSDEGKDLELEFAGLMGEGRTSDAGALLIRAMAPDLKVPGIDRLVGAALIKVFFGRTHPYFAKDVVTEAEAVAAFDAREVLPQITVPVLLFGCDRDVEFSREVYEETARLIPDCTLRLYEGKTAFQAGSDKQLPLDVLDFVRQHPPVQPEHRPRKRTTADQQGVADETLVAPGEPPLRGEKPAGPEPSLTGTGVG